MSFLCSKNETNKRPVKALAAAVSQRNFTGEGERDVKRRKYDER